VHVGHGIAVARAEAILQHAREQVMLIATRYARSDVSASNTSAIAVIRPSIGICSSRNLRG
jgi:hypothetical protein